MSNGEVFTDIAGKYDRINRILSLGQDQAWRQTVVDRLPHGRILDLGGGTGAANPVFGDRTVVALDPSPEMLELNEATARVVAVGERLPFSDGAFDAVFSAYVFRNLDSVNGTLVEIARVLRPGGKAGIVDLGRPVRKWAATVHRAGSRVVLPTVGRFAGAADEYRYLHDSLDKLPPPEVMYASGPLRLEDTWRMGPLGFVYGAILAKA
ncbi:MAG TPA: class I SAM-dependent methyltransferase [Acidimicrobiia bacterium]|nr:class I SAM-dependent methyltransferase [Acidimicrobiia bacterium]